MSLQNLTAKQLLKAAKIQERIGKLNAKLTKILGSAPEIKVPGKRGPKKGGMSVAGRARIAAAQKLRWAKVNAAKGKARETAKPAKRKMSAAGRSAIIAAQKLRWSKIKAGKKA